MTQTTTARRPRAAKQPQPQIAFAPSAPVHRYDKDLTRLEVLPRTVVDRILGRPARVDRVTHRAVIWADRPVKIDIVEERGALRPVFNPPAEGFTYMADGQIVELERAPVNYGGATVQRLTLARA